MLAKRTLCEVSAARIAHRNLLRGYIGRSPGSQLLLRFETGYFFYGVVNKVIARSFIRYKLPCRVHYCLATEEKFLSSNSQQA